MPLGTLEVAAGLHHWITENAKTTRAYLKRVNDVVALCQPLQALNITELPREVHKKGDHTGNFDARPLCWQNGIHLKLCFQFIPSCNSQNNILNKTYKLI